MNHEHPQRPSEPEQPRSASPPEADAAYGYAARAEQHFREAAQLYAAQLALDDAHDPTATELRLAFETAYLGSYDEPHDFVVDTIDRLGWREAISHISLHAGIPEGAVSLNLPRLYAYLSRYYRILEGTGTAIHVFSKPGVGPLLAELPQGGER